MRRWRIRSSDRRRLTRGRGQSLVEFALLLPILLLMTMAALDLGRLYLGYVNLQNMARVASNFAANNPTAWDTPNDPAVTKYRNQVLADATATNCDLTPAIPAPPSFADADGDLHNNRPGDRVTVTFTCGFKLVTPFLSSFMGGTINVSATSVFPVKSGMSGTFGSGTCALPSAAINATPVTGTSPLTVNFMDASGGGTGTSWLWEFGDGRTSTLRDPGAVIYSTSGTFDVYLTVYNICGENKTLTPKTISVTTTASPGPGASPGASPSLCTVPNFAGTSSSTAQATWTAARFTTTVKFQQGGLPWTIKSQNVVAGSSAPCGSPITVSKS